MLRTLLRTHKFATFAFLSSVFGTGWLLAQSDQPPTLPQQNAAPILPVDGVAPSPLDDETDPNIEVLTRGPVHEAFAEQYSADPEPGIIINRAPPEPIDELPPDMMPDGENVEWIPGYWDWDEDREDFLWVSGLWRDVPPEQRWVPGYWVQADGGYQWVPGFWTSVNADRVAYLPAPPPSQENGPNIPAPGDDYFWSPGCWVYDTTYQWRPGYWVQARPDWVWVPPCYNWTPNGYVFTGGFWDYPPMARGTLFAPFFVRGGFYGRPFRPRVVVPFGPLMVHLFIRPGRSHYYFGNYYGDRFVNRGFYPWIDGHRFHNRRFHDPMWNYYRFGRRESFNRFQGWSRYYHRHEDFRPPVTLAASREFRNRDHGRSRADINVSILGTSFDSVVRDRNGRGGNAGFHRLDDARRQRITEDLKHVRTFQQERSRLAGQVERDRGGDRNSSNDRARGPDRRDLELPQLASIKERRDRLNTPDIRDGLNRSDRDGNAGRNGFGRDGSNRVRGPEQSLRDGRAPEPPRISRGGTRPDNAETSRDNDGGNRGRDRSNADRNGNRPELNPQTRERLQDQRQQLQDRVRNARPDNPSGIRGGAPDLNNRNNTDRNRGPIDRDRNNDGPSVTPQTRERLQNQQQQLRDRIRDSRPDNPSGVRGGSRGDNANRPSQSDNSSGPSIRPENPPTQRRIDQETRRPPTIDRNLPGPNRGGFPRGSDTDIRSRQESRPQVTPDAGRRLQLPNRNPTQSIQPDARIRQQTPDRNLMRRQVEPPRSNALPGSNRQIPVRPSESRSQMRQDRAPTRSIQPNSIPSAPRSSARGSGGSPSVPQFNGGGNRSPSFSPSRGSSGRGSGGGDSGNRSSRRGGR